VSWFGRNLRHGLAALTLVALLAACEDMRPYRTQFTADVRAAPQCDPGPRYDVPEACRAQSHEHSRDYDLFFTEFTDQGLQYPSEVVEQREAGYQINHALEGLKEIAKEPSLKGISVIVYVHGWKHNARHDDPDVASFRALLHAAASLERAQGSGYRIVGVYVGWRGLSIRGEPISNLSFWARKATALRVAQGSPRELFNRLRSFKCAQNRAAARTRGQAADSGNCTEPASAGPRQAKVRMMMIGHSFGGWILYNAVAGSLIESLTTAADTEDPDAQNPRFADMIVLLNPAFEASRYTPLHRIATTVDYKRYQAPLLVSVTTTKDWATGVAFPIGRFFNSIFERSAGPEESDAIVSTMGHMELYLTHELTASGERPEECRGWRVLQDISDPDARSRQARINFEAEKANTDAFPGMRHALDPHWERTFCGGARLRHVRYNPNSVIWNVRTDETIMKGHNDITNPLLIDFVRQLYRDTLLYPLPAGSNVVPPGRGGPSSPAGAQ
jgi:hypothetical protein